MGLQVAAANKIINEFAGLAFAGGEFETDNPAIRFVSAEAWTANAQGAHIDFCTAAIGTTDPVRRLRITSEGLLLFSAGGGTAKFGVNVDTPLTTLHVGTSSTSSPRGILSAQYSTGTDGARVGFLKARGTEASPTTVVTGDTLGRLMFRGYDGSNYLEMASIEAVSTGTIAATRVPTYIAFSTATNAAPSVLTEAMRITNTQNLLVGTTTDDGASKLQVAGALKLATDGTSQIIFQNGSSGQTRQAFIKWNNKSGGAEWYLGNDPNVSGGALFQLLDASGNVVWTAETNKNTLFGGQTNGGYRVDVQSSGSSGTLRVYDQTATTGSTSLAVRAGAGQSTNAIVNITANDGTTSVFKVLETKIGFFNATPVVKQTVTADAASILAALQAYGLAV